MASYKNMSHTIFEKSIQFPHITFKFKTDIIDTSLFV